MANSYLNIVTFLLTTIFYYLALKPSLPYSLYKDKEQYKSFVSNNYMCLAIYVLLVIVIQFIVNSSIISSTCGGNISENMGAAGVMTFIPWILIFGVLVVILTVYPGFKSAFSDVIGYYYVSGTATKLLTELLINQDIEKKMTEDPNMTPEKKEALENTADVIIKICGNTSILINQIVPNNFENYWSILKPLMKDKYKIDGPDSDKMKNDLFEIVLTRDNVGEAMWYIYTGLLLTSIVQLKITTRGCQSNPKTMEANYQKFLQQEATVQQQKQNAAATYTVTT
jgi:hypothetical protein